MSFDVGAENGGELALRVLWTHGIASRVKAQGVGQTTPAAKRNDVDAPDAQLLRPTGGRERSQRRDKEVL